MASFRGSFHMNIILGIAESTVAIDIQSLHQVFARGTGIKQLGDLLDAPWPEDGSVDAIRYRKADADQRIAVGHSDWLVVLPSLQIVPDGVIEGVLHPFRFRGF